MGPACLKLTKFLHKNLAFYGCLALKYAAFGRKLPKLVDNFHVSRGMTACSCHCNQLCVCIEVRVITDGCLNMFCRFVFLCQQIFAAGVVHRDRPVSVLLLNQLLPSLLQLHSDAVPNVRITLARCLAQSSACFGMSSLYIN